MREREERDEREREREGNERWWGRWERVKEISREWERERERDKWKYENSNNSNLRLACGNLKRNNNNGIFEN